MIENFSPYIRKAWYSTLDPGTVIGERDIFDYELLYLKEGTARITVSGTDYDAAPGDVFIFRPHQRHRIVCLNSQPVIQPHVHFDLQFREDYQEVYIPFCKDSELPMEEHAFFRKDIIDDLSYGIPARIHPLNQTLFEEYLFDLIHEYDHPGLHPQVRLQWMFLRLLDLYLEEVAYSLRVKGSSASDDIAAKIRMYLDTHSSTPVSISELANLIHIDKSYLIRVFKNAYGCTPLAYHQKIRIHRAHNMLIYTNLSVTDIAAATGFSSIHDFDRVFKKIEGSSPSAFRHK